MNLLKGLVINMNIDINLIDSISLGYGELALKGKNRGTFERNIKKRIKNKIKDLDCNAVLIDDMSKLFIEFDKGNAKKVMQSIKNVFGINNIALCVKTNSDISSIKNTLTMLGNNVYESGARTFKVAVNRADKNFSGNSMELSKDFGANILITTKFENVKMKDPDCLFNVDIRKNTYIYTEKIKAYGGLPLGSAGKGLVLISGGIDSPVASFMMAKRGLKLAFVTFHSFPFTSKKSLEKIEELVKILSSYNGASAFYKINILELQQAIKENTNKDLATILTRRVMMKLARRIAHENEYQALVTGESLGQVASQTIGGLSCTNASVDLPVFRPLIGMDKIEIIEMANEIGTYEKSIEPHEDSCALFAPKHPITNPKLSMVIEEENKIKDYDELLNRAFDNKEFVIVKQE